MIRDYSFTIINFGLAPAFELVYCGRGRGSLNFDANRWGRFEGTASSICAGICIPDSHSLRPIFTLLTMGHEAAHFFPQLPNRQKAQG